MPMQRKRVYRIGFVLIVVSVLLSPLSYITLGRIEKGRVIQNVFEYSGLTILPYSSYPQIEFKYCKKSYRILGEENQVFLIGEEVKVIFYKWNPQKAKVFTFGGLFINSFIQLPIGLLIWWALFQSFPRLFSSPNEPKWFDNLMGKSKNGKRRDAL